MQEDRENDKIHKIPPPPGYKRSQQLLRRGKPEELPTSRAGSCRGAASVNVTCAEMGFSAIQP